MKYHLNNGKDRIENETDLMTWCKEVNSGNHKFMCDLQDIFTRSETKDLKQFFLDSNDKELIIFCIGKAIGSEQQFNFMKCWARHQAEICIEENETLIHDKFKELNVRSAELTERERVFDSLNKEIKDLDSERARLNNELVESRQRNWELSCRNDELNDEIKEQYEIIEKNSEFEARIKSLMTA